MDTENSVQDEVGEIETTGTEVQEAPVENVSGDKAQDKSDYEALLKEVEGLRKATRSFQSEKDLAVKEKKALDRRVQELEKTLEGIRGKYGEDDEFTSTLDNLELKSYRDREKAQAEYNKRIQEYKVETNDIAEEIRSYGLEPNNPAFDEVSKTVKRLPDGWLDLRDLRRKLIAKARELSTKENKVTNDIDEKLAAMEKRLLSRMGLDTEENIPPVGSPEVGIEKLVRRYSEGDDLSPAEEKKVKEYLNTLKK